MGFLGLKTKKKLTDSVEDTLAQIEHDMVSHCAGYADYQPKRTFIVVANESNYISVTFFFELHKKIYRYNELENVSKNYDASPEKQEETLKFLNKQARKIIKIFKREERDVPTITKMEYNSHNHSFKVDYIYENAYEGERSNAAEAFAQDWMREQEINL